MDVADLFTQKPCSILQSIKQEISTLERLEYFLNQASVAVTHFKYGRLFHFDPHVGDTCCQIRAYLYARMYQNREHILIEVDQFLNNLPTCIQILKNEQAKRKLGQVVCQKISLENFLRKFEINITEEIIWLLLGYVLTVFSIKDQENISHSVNYKGLSYNSNESASFSNLTIRHWQKLMSKVSVDFIYDLLSELLNSNISIIPIESVLSQTQLKAENGRSVLPCYCATEIILMHIRYISYLPMSFIVTVDNGYKKNLFNFSIGSKGDENEACFLTRVLAVNNTPLSNEDYFLKLRSFYRKHNIFHLYQLYAADHPQYTGKILAKHKDNFDSLIGESYDMRRLNSELKHLQQKAKTLGCAKSHPFYFYVKHILCDTIYHLSTTQNKLPALSGAFYFGDKHEVN